jgi:hypothetical protein
VLVTAATDNMAVADVKQLGQEVGFVERTIDESIHHAVHRWWVEQHNGVQWRA